MGKKNKKQKRKEKQRAEATGTNLLNPEASFTKEEPSTSKVIKLKETKIQEPPFSNDNKNTDKNKLKKRKREENNIKEAKIIIENKAKVNEIRKKNKNKKQKISAKSTDNNTKTNNNNNNDDDDDDGIKSLTTTDLETKHTSKNIAVTTTTTTKPSSSSNSKEYPYPVDYCDHFETSKTAYEDIYPALSSLAKSLGKDEKSLCIYDPYYCAGSTLSILNQLGFENVIHRKRDFYADVANGDIPEYDVLVTNPPYSEDHKEKCIKFCVDSKKPWLLLMPNYVANKQYYRSLVTGNEFYISPKLRYEYNHPKGTGHQTSPFFSFWFLNLNAASSKIFLEIESKVRNRNCTIVRKLEFLKDQKLVPTTKRLNNKRRKKMMAQRKGI